MAPQIKDNEEYYKILGLPKTASEEDIKRGYRKAALKWHPDKNPDNKEHAEQMFKEVAGAYAVLSDPNKKIIYDQYGKAGLDGSSYEDGGIFEGIPNPFSKNPFGSGDIHPIILSTEDAMKVFNRVFGDKDPFADFDDLFGPKPGDKKGGFFGGLFGGGEPVDPFANMGDGSKVTKTSGTGGGTAGYSTSKKTVVVNGKKTIVTEKTVRKADGTSETTKMEADGPPEKEGQENEQGCIVM